MLSTEKQLHNYSSLTSTAISPPTEPKKRLSGKALLLHKLEKKSFSMPSNIRPSRSPRHSNSVLPQVKQNALTAKHGNTLEYENTVSAAAYESMHIAASLYEDIGEFMWFLGIHV